MLLKYWLQQRIPGGYCTVCCRDVIFMKTDIKIATLSHLEIPHSWTIHYKKQEMIKHNSLHPHCRFNIRIQLFCLWNWTTIILIHIDEALNLGRFCYSMSQKPILNFLYGWCSNNAIFGVRTWSTQRWSHTTCCCISHHSPSSKSTYVCIVTNEVGNVLLSLASTWSTSY